MLYAKPRDRQRLGGVSSRRPDRANRTFYFASFEEYRQTRRQLGPFDRTVPTPAFLDGDFSALLDTPRSARNRRGGQPDLSRRDLRSAHAASCFPATSFPPAAFRRCRVGSPTLYRQSYQPMVAGRLIEQLRGPRLHRSGVHAAPVQRQGSITALTNDGRLSGSLHLDQSSTDACRSGRRLGSRRRHGRPVVEVAQARGHHLPGARSASAR